MYTMTDITDQIAQRVISKVNKSTSGALVGMKLTLRWSDFVTGAHGVRRRTTTGRVHRITLSEGSVRTRTFPGWVGRVWVRFSAHSDIDGDVSRYLRSADLHTGTRDFGAYNGPWTSLYHLWHQNRDVLKDWPEPRFYSWDCRLFYDDFVDICNDMDTIRAFAALSGESSEWNRSEFWWEDPEVEQHDWQMYRELELASRLEVPA